MLIKQNNKQSYGAVHTKDYFKFIGFYKNTLENNSQKIDIYLNNKKTTTIESNVSNEELENIYDINDKNICFEYTLPDEYIKENTLISFKYHDTQKELTNSPIDFSKIEYFNEKRFLHSLNQPINEEKMKNMYCPNSIGFLALEENLADPEFINYIKFLNNKYSQYKIIAFFIQKQPSYKNNPHFDFVKISELNDILKECRVFIHNNLRKQTPWYNKFRREILLKGKNNLQIIIDKDKSELMSDAIKRMDNSDFMLNYRKYGLTEEDIKKGQYIYYKIYFEKALNDSISINTSDYKYRWELTHVKIIEFALENLEFIHFINNLKKNNMEIK